jgi:outer membrane protein assembly factor BamB
VQGGKVWFATSDTALLQAVDARTGQEVLKEDAKAYVFSSPVIAGDVVLTAVLNGSLQARDLATGKLLWQFRTEASRANRGWVLSKEERFNSSWLFASAWQEATTLAFAKQESVGSFYATPLVKQGVIYLGSADGSLYAIE